MRKYMALIACLSLLSCSSVGYLSMDTLSPSELSFPPDIKTVGVVDNAVFHDTLRAPSSGITVGTIEGNGKIMAARLAGELADADYFDGVILCNSSLRSGDSINYPAKLTQATVQKLASDLQVDMLITVDGISIKTWPDVAFFDYLDEFVDVVAGQVSSVISIYVPSRKEPMHMALGAQDTLYWNLGHLRLSEKRIVEEASERAADLQMKYLVPRWQPEERFYYMGGSIDMRDAYVSIQEEDWDGAFRLWKHTYDTSKPKSKKRMRSAVNLALYYETQGNVSDALKFAKEAMAIAKPGSQDRVLIKRYYIDRLGNKLVSSQKLDLQMKRFQQK